MPELLTLAMHRRAELVHAIDALDWSTADDLADLLEAMIKSKRSTAEAVWVTVVAVEHLQQQRKEATLTGRDHGRCALIATAISGLSARLGFAALTQIQHRETRPRQTARSSATNKLSITK